MWCLKNRETRSDHCARILRRWKADDSRSAAGGDELFWHWVSYPPRRSRACEASGYSGDMRCQFGGDNLGVAVERQNGQRLGDASSPRLDGKRAAGGMCRGRSGDGDRIGGDFCYNTRPMKRIVMMIALFGASARRPTASSPSRSRTALGFGICADIFRDPLVPFRLMCYNVGSYKPIAVLVERQCRQILRRHFGVAVVVFKDGNATVLH